MKQAIKEKIKELSEKKYQKFQNELCPNTSNILGVRVPVLRDYAKKLAKDSSIETILKEIDNEYYEEIMLQGMLIGMMKDDFKEIKKQIKQYVPKIDNWAVCDVFCAGLKVAKKNKKEMWELIQEYTKSNKEFELRFGIVMILDYYIEDEYIDKDFEIFNNIECQEYYVQMALAWAISICLIKFYDRTLTYLKTAKLDTFTYNKAIQKAIESYRIDDEQKKYLKTLKK